MNVPTIGANFDIAGYNTVKCTGDPNKDAQNFADANNITVAEAKKILSGQFGDPAKKSNATAKSAATIDDVDDDVELDDDADIDDLDETSTTYAGEAEDDELDDIDFDDNEDDDVDNTTADDVDTYIDDMQEKYQEAANTYNAWAKSSFTKGGSTFNTALQDLQASIADFLDYVDTIDMTNLDASAKSAIEEAKDYARKWNDRFETSTTKSWGNNSELKAKVKTANSKARKYTAYLITLLQNAGLATKTVTKASKPTAE